MPGTILLVDDVSINRVILRVKLTAARYHVIEAKDGVTALARARSDHPDLILMDVQMPGLDGLEVCRKLKANPATAGIPVVIFSGYPVKDTKIEALAAGAEEFMSRPIDEPTLMARIRSLLRARHTTQELALRDETLHALGLSEPPAPAFRAPGRVAIIARDTDIAQVWCAKLADRMRHEIKVVTRAQLARGTHAADLYVVEGDLKQPGTGDGLQMIAELRAGAETRNAAIVMILHEQSRLQSAMALDLGATDIVVGPFDAEELALRLRTHMRRKREADSLRKRLTRGLELAVTDPLTGLFNRRYALSHLARVRRHAQESERSFAVMMLDLDRFKMVNDQHGHAAGDTVLRTVAQRLKANLRAVDMLARIGGEEFLAVLPDCDAETAARAAERLRSVVKREPILLDNPPETALQQTISIGVVAVTHAGASDTGRAVCTNEDDLLRYADRALYDAKASGRNTVAVGELAA